MKVFGIIVILVALSEVYAGPERKCGTALSEVLDTICHNFNSKLSKKSVPMHHDIDIMNMYNDIEDEGGMPSLFLDNMLMGGHINTIAKTRRSRHLMGIVDECCVKGCSYSELRAYCS